MKFLVGGKVIMVCGEEEYMVSHLASFLYVEVEGEFHELLSRISKFFK